ncbi:MAG: small-conductance mechanosensitive channel [Glaciecola sp.]|jgi:small-conductance mechanosensitive channel
MAFKIDNETLLSIGFAIGAVAFLLILIFGINRLFKFTDKKIHSLAGDKIKGLSFKNYQFLTPKYTASLIVTGFKIVRLLILLIIFYFWLPLFFSIFHWTKDISNTLIGYTIKPLKSLGSSFVDYLPSLLFIGIVFFIVRYINKIINFFAKEISNERLRIDGFYKEWAKPTSIIVKLIIYVFALVFVFPYLPGSGSPAFQGVSIFVGVLLSLGSTGFVANAVSGLMIIYMRPFVIGDVVKIGEHIGTVVSKQMLVTRLNTPKNEEISIPNKMIVEGQIVNYSSEEKGVGIFMHTIVTLGYDVSWRDVHEVMIEAAKRTSEIIDDPKPFVLQTALNDFNVSYELNAYTKNPAKMGGTYSELHQNLQDCLNEKGIEILSPHYRVERSSNETTIPKAYRK